jgi:hypothetical protein
MTDRRLSSIVYRGTRGASAGTAGRSKRRLRGVAEGGVEGLTIFCERIVTK